MWHCSGWRGLVGRAATGLCSLELCGLLLLSLTCSWAQRTSNYRVPSRQALQRTEPALEYCISPAHGREEAHSGVAPKVVSILWWLGARDGRVILQLIELLCGCGCWVCGVGCLCTRWRCAGMDIAINPRVIQHHCACHRAHLPPIYIPTKLHTRDPQYPH
jgi:hypothetical protein